MKKKIQNIPLITFFYVEVMTAFAMGLSRRFIKKGGGFSLLSSTKAFSIAGSFVKMFAPFVVVFLIYSIDTSS
jgi:hypothetical protein